MTETLVIARHVIRDNIAGKFELSTEIDPTTGEYKMRSVPRIVQPGEWVKYPEEMARGFIASGAAREPTETELALHRLSKGAVR